MTALRVDDVLLGKYRIEGVIGQGGMGIIVAAHHLQLGERVALKFLRRDILELPVAAERFISEARAAIRIKSEHVARVIDVNALEDGTPFIVMEYLEGETLSAFAGRHRPLSLESTVEFVLQICEAIAEAHALGIVHRDLKPANIFIIKRADGIHAAKVLDFGISKVCSPLAPAVGPDEEVMALGSPAYASPEQIQTPHDVDARSDLWSLGVILYELASGRLPFEDESTFQLCGKVLHDEPKPLDAARDCLPKALVDVVMRCLQKQRELRFNNVGELARALSPLAPSRARSSVERIIRTVVATGINVDPGALVTDANSSSDDGATSAAEATGAEERQNRPPRRRHRLAWALSVLALGIAVFAAAALPSVRRLIPGTSSAQRTPRVFALEEPASELALPQLTPAKASYARMAPVSVTRLKAEEGVDVEEAAALETPAPRARRRTGRPTPPQASQPSSEPLEQGPPPAASPNRRRDGDNLDLFSIRKP